MTLSKAPVIALGLAMLLLGAACTGAPSGVPAMSGTQTPSTSVRPSPSSTPPPTEPPPTPAVAEPTLQPPPTAALIVGGHRYVGTIGGFTWKDHGDDAPWLPATALVRVLVPPAAALSVELDGAAVGSWAVRMARADDPTGHAPTPLGDGRDRINLRGPASGSWVVMVDVQYADGLGDGAYYWRLDVQ